MLENRIYDRCRVNQTALNLMALDAYIYGYPLVLTDVTRKIMLANGLKVNRFLNERVFPDPHYTTIVRPNVDTLYSMAWLDLSREPVILVVPDTHNRYYLLELLDPWTNVFASIGARTTGTKEGAYAIAGPRWNGMPPEGTIRVDAPADTVWVIGRTQTNGPEEYPPVHVIQNGYKLIPLSRWEKPAPVHLCGYGKDTPDLNPADQVAAMDAAAFFQTMMRAMAGSPPWITDPAMNEELAALGLAPDRNFSFSALNPSSKQSLRLAAAYGPQQIAAEAGAKYMSDNVAGWLVPRNNIGFYGADYRQRAAVALEGIGANLPQDAVYAPAFSDAAGVPLCGYNNYNLHFAPEQFPPTHAFWSITLYNSEGYLAENPIHRYAVSPHLERLNVHSDGSFDIFIGNAPPDQKRAANWLPAPEGRFNLLLRIYWPEQPVLSGQWTPPAIYPARNG